MSNQPEVQLAKAELRRTVLARLRGRTAEQRTRSGAALADQVSAVPGWSQARHILGFAPLSTEPDIWPVLLRALSAGKAVALPRFDRIKQSYEACFITHPVEDLLVGHFGISEPATHCVVADSKLLDFTLVPGIAFDVQGRRLGRGKGFYDRLLQGCAGLKCGICLDEQVLQEIPTEPHDVRMDYIITPTRIIYPVGLT